ncbi:bifunctional DNA-formamidopyrimidine glycosylase/DNA-(apurinic or apyrimidinic site) lyase [Pandoraea pnomenusa]|uniref:Formamidopyrimidine-DNA glycosylase n=1 Tax=Pandoraea pnomenusa TaxID=93220 RepID=A0A378YR90_9BURK|nr:bifunctional DNA-formamidopyrimidine glycosylase/DNA-(apurinic or apyrimidinic site) lyase [Pandoraea pnomenusa]AHB07521.1 formamidopyrimidine-DNA glycosylase [Pandoraea pnomenusa 3kgm]AHN75389.1 formamidopyrimidine-DNA glycosylase [Pandoraea pnomenusa]AIU28033.1 formamidopyrimidine-DNA glycosylase [Pandoraea pnomenusa]ANC45174.1 formamidopyrimidine-DNA glycosylase [Pandoraea pnomenusa]MBN9093448.1 bifunctional DNA-formamidopyrimidine glycosylase/DNA-(apurinic or apyrimidinic site) lyase [P
MPELPEVEVTRRGIAPHVAGTRVARIDVRNASLRWPVPDGLDARLRGETLIGVTRRGKYLLLEYAPGWLLVHLGMTGTLRVMPEPHALPAAGVHDHIDLVFEHCALRYRDPRRFGAVLFHPRASGDVLLHPLLASLGVEPLTDAFDGAWLHAGTRGRTVSIKQALLAGSIVVGVGNIYASESLFRARIHPRMPAGKLTRPRAGKLAAAVKEVLAAAIEKGGSTLRDFVGSDGKSGYFQQEYFVYDRAGLPCRVCGTPIRQIVQGQRSTFFCPHCQK